MRHMYMPPMIEKEKTFTDATGFAMHPLVPSDVLVHAHGELDNCDSNSHAFFKAEVGKLEDEEAFEAINKALHPKG